MIESQIPHIDKSRNKENNKIRSIKKFYFPDRGLQNLDKIPKKLLKIAGNGSKLGEIEEKALKN